jgi:branched-chain amino acid transport system substrate-binding protein
MGSISRTIAPQLSDGRDGDLQHLELPMLLPGITINTSPTNFAPIRQAQLSRFDGERYVPFGPVLSGATG